MRVDVYNREQIENLFPVKGAVMISINTPPRTEWDDGFADLRPGWEDVLQLSFHDFVNEGDEDLFNGWVVFTPSMAKEIHAFVEKNSGKDFVIHCTAGQSRSVAVGVFLRDVHNAELFLHAADNEASANSLVRRTLMRTEWEKQFNSV